MLRHNCQSGVWKPSGATSLERRVWYVNSGSNYGDMVVFNGQSAVTCPFFFEKGNIDIGEQVYINANCTFLDHALISIGDYTLIGPNVTLTTADHNVSPDSRQAGIIAKPITIGRNVWLGAGVVVLPGVTIGDNSVVAANSVVRADIEAGALYAGSPAVYKRAL